MTVCSTAPRALKIHSALLSHNTRSTLLLLRHCLSLPLISYQTNSALSLLGTRKKEEDALYGRPEDLDGEEEEEKSLTAHEKIVIGRKRLPIYAYREEFLEAVRDNKIIVVVGETGSGQWWPLLLSIFICVYFLSTLRIYMI